MPEEADQRLTEKQERRRARKRAARGRRLRKQLRRWGLLAVIPVAGALWQYYMSGEDETVQAEVIRTEIYRHQPRTGPAHTHQRATIEIEAGVTETLDRADQLQRGQLIPVRIQRGRLTGRAYFLNRDELSSSALPSADVGLPQAVPALTVNGTNGMDEADEADEAEILSPESLEEQRAAGNALLVIDVRTAAEFRSGHIPGALNIPHTEISARLDEVRSENGVVLYCMVGPRARLAEKTLMEAGLEKVYHLEGGLAAWKEADLPLSSD